jgi:hypothetical protein
MKDFIYAVKRMGFFWGPIFLSGLLWCIVMAITVFTTTAIMVYEFWKAILT